MSQIIREPPSTNVYWDGAYSRFLRGGAIERFIESLLTAYPRLRVRLIQTDGITDESPPVFQPSVVVCALATRRIFHPSIILMPLDDTTFDSGLSSIVQPYRLDWDKKKPIVFWRGGASGLERPIIRHRVAAALYHHPSTDVKISRQWGWENGKSIPDRLFSERVSFSEHFRYKYILIVDGNMIASNHQWVFGSGSVPIMVSHPENRYWFQRFMVPGVHYVEVAYDLSDLNDKIDWLLENDDAAREIVQNAVHFSEIVFSSEFQKTYLAKEFQRLAMSEMSAIDLCLQNRCETASDINEHLMKLSEYASKCQTVVECGVRGVTSSYAFAAALRGVVDNRLLMIDLDRSPSIDRFLLLCRAEGVNAEFHQGSDLECPLPKSVDLLFIDTWHVYGHLRRELERWHSVVSRYIILHDTSVDEWEGETIRCGLDAEQQSRDTGLPIEEIRRGLWPAVEEFLAERKEWRLERRYYHNNGLTVLSKT